MSLTTAAIMLVSFMLPPVPTKTRNWLTASDKVVPFEGEDGNSTTDESFIQSTVRPPTITQMTTQHFDVLSVRFVSAQAQLDRYSSLEDGWDGEGAFAPSKEVIATAKHLLRCLPAGISLPSPMISATGEVGFYWNNATGFADISIEDADTFSLFTKQKVGEKREAFYEGIVVTPASVATIKEYLAPLGRV